MAAPDNPRMRSGRLSTAKLAQLVYVAGYVLYLVPALVWGWRTGVDPFVGFALWQALLYAPLWPIVLFVQAYQFLIPLL